MPKIIIREKDYTSAGDRAYDNFAVLVPGLVSEDSNWNNIADENGVYEVSNQKDFIENVGLVPYATETEGVKLTTSYGNKIAYELLGLGYTVLYKKIESADDITFANLKPLIDKSAYDFRYIVTGLIGDADANEAIRALAHFDETTSDPFETGRGDCTALCDVEIDKTGTVTGAPTTASKYVSYFAPSFCMKDYKGPKEGEDYVYSNNIFPASFYYLACAKKARLNNFDEWFAVAGYTRGIADFTIESTDVRVGEILVNKLQPRNNAGDFKGPAVNLITNIRGNFYLWGNRTAEALREDNLIASHFLNIRQLCSTIKKQVYIACRRFTFDPNSDVLWINLCNAITPMLERMKANQGIEDYIIEQVETSEKAKLKAKIRIIPIEAVEDFELELSLEDTFGMASATITE